MQIGSNRELARQLGVSETAIRKAEKTGRIRKESDGGWDLTKVKAAWGSNTDQGQQRGRMKPVPEAAVGAVRDTLKEVDDKDVVSRTLPRDHCVAVQTPQGFATKALRAAHAATEGSYTDDAGMVEENGGRVVVIPGDPRNMKVTFPEDLAVVRALVAAEAVE